MSRLFSRSVIIAAGFAFACAGACASEPQRFSARATLERAQVGTYGPRGEAPRPVVVRGARTVRAADRVERLYCRPDLLDREVTICDFKGTR
ncbi:putative outer membrane lipoprotein [Stenotrophomonas phage Sonora]|nr:putative outer membrane lipoprotein [Stenotrophomonas phage Sonora]